MFSNVLTQTAVQPITWQQLNAFGAGGRGEDNLRKVKAASLRKGKEEDWSDFERGKCVGCQTGC